MTTRGIVALATGAALACSLLGCADGSKADSGTGPEEVVVDTDGDGAPDEVDCDPTDPAVFPGATEICSGVDEDCDGEIDEADAADATDWFPDADGDSFGDAASPTRACEAPPGLIADGSDCDDSDPLIHPGAEEVPCNGISESCSGDGGPRLPEEHDTLQQAIDAAEEGGMVCVGPGSWPGPARITRTVTLVSTGEAADTVLSGRERDSILEIDGAADVVVEGFTFIDGRATFGAAVRLDNAPRATLSGNTFLRNQALADGGAISIDSSDDVRITTNFFDRNEADGHGGAVRVVDSAGLRFSVNTVSRNQAGRSGGGVYLLRAATASVSGGQLDRNLAEDGAGLSAVDCNALTVEAATVNSNTASGLGGGLYIDGGTSVLLDELTVRDNTAASGAGLTIWETTGVTLQQSAVRSHLVDTYGAGLLLRSTAEVSVVDTDFDTNSAGQAGGGIAVRETATLSLSGGTFVDGFGGLGGGVALLDGGTVTVSGSTFRDHTADTAGAALYAAGGVLSATDVVFQDNLPDDVFCETAASCSVAEAGE